MKEKTYYATPEMVKNYHKQLAREGCRELPEFPEALIQMEEKGLLSDYALPNPVLNGQMSPEDFMIAYDRIPFEVKRVLEVLRKEREERNQIALADHVDVACAQHIHAHGFTSQSYQNVYAFTYIYQGICSIMFDTALIELHPGDLFIASPGLLHYVHTTADAFAIEAVVRASAFEILFHDFLTSDLSLSRFFRRYSVDKSIGNYCVIRTDPEDSEIRFYIQSFAAECMDKQTDYFNSCAISLLKLLLARAFRKYQDSISFYQQNPVETMDVAWLYRYIQLNYQTITLDQIARQFHYNRTYLSRFIHQHFQKTFSEIVTEIRISHAKEYLRKTNKRIAEIASLAGYESLNHFSRMFRKYVGMTPGEYRKTTLPAPRSNTLYGLVGLEPRRP